MSGALDGFHDCVSNFGMPSVLAFGLFSEPAAGCSPRWLFDICAHANCRNDWFTHPDFKPSKSPLADKNRAAFKKLQEENWASWLAQQGQGKFPEEADRAR